MIFLDTPGLLEPRDLLQRTMLSSALEALAEADVILLVLDGSRALKPPGLGWVEEVLAERPPVPLLVAINKSDLTGEAAQEEIAQWVSQEMGGESFLVCALDGEGVPELRARLQELLPLGPFLYPVDDIARDPVRFFVTEMIRETVFQEYHEEIPYSTFGQVEEFRENEDPVYIQVHLFVERDSQKRILIGKRGSSIRRLGVLSREKIEEFLGRKVYLDLWVKVLPDWRRKRTHLKRLGFPVPDEGPDA
jgi:GTP-binding protein Era